MRRLGRAQGVAARRYPNDGARVLQQLRGDLDGCSGRRPALAAACTPPAWAGGCLHLHLFHPTYHVAFGNERGPEREQVIFRFQPDELRGGKIGGKGFPELSGEAEACVMDKIRAQITDCWRGWGGMATVAREERPATEKLRSELQRWFAQHGSAVARDE